MLMMSLWSVIVHARYYDRYRCYSVIGTAVSLLQYSVITQRDHSDGFIYRQTDIAATA